MTFATLLPLVLQYGPSVVPIIQKLVAAIAAGHGSKEVSDADWAELVRLATQKGEDIYLRLGIVPPPPASVLAPAPAAAPAAVAGQHGVVTVTAPVNVVAPAA